MKFLIRDDDTCAFTSPRELDECYSDIYDQIPVCLSVTPFRIAGKYFETSDTDTEHQLNSNQELVDYLQNGIKLNRFQIALHGYSHVYHNDLNHQVRTAEYAMNDGLMDKTIKAKAYLEHLLQTKINTFVPPSNVISRHGFESVVASRLNLMHVTSFRPSRRPFRMVNVFNFMRIKLWENLRKYPIYPFPLDFGDHMEMQSHLLYPSSRLEILLDQLEYTHSIGGVFSLATHYHAFSKRIASGETISYAFNKIIERALSKNDIEFIGYNQLWGED